VIARGLVFAALAALAATALSWGVYGREAGTIVLQIVLPLGFATVLGAAGLARLGGRLGPLARQFALAGLLIAAQLAAVVVLFVETMFFSGHDAFFAGVAVGYAALLGGWTVWALRRRGLDDVDRVREVLSAVAAGRRDVRSNVAGGDEIAALAADVDAMIDRLDAEERARRSLIAVVSHDLRTPVTSLRLLAEALEDDVFEPGGRAEPLARLTTHVRALSALIDDLFELTRLEAGEIRWSIEQVELAELVRETVEAMRPAADERSVAVRADLAPELAPARGNPERIQRVLFNLIQNAIRHTPQDGSVVVRAERDGNGGLEIEVADTGEGIAPAERSHVFDAFYQGGARSGGDSSAGLGLAISRAIVEAHGGRIWLGPCDRGTSVRFTLPCAER